MDSRNQKFLSEDQRQRMYLAYQITLERAAIMRDIETSMHKQIDPQMEKVEIKCPHCSETFKGKEYGAHFRNNKECKYLKDRPWLKNKLPSNWQSDLSLFNQQMDEYQ